MMKLQEKIAFAASLIFFNLNEKSSSFMNTCFLTNELTMNCKLKFLPAWIWFNKAQFGTTNISVFLYLLLSPLFLLKSVSLPWRLLAGISDNLMYNLELSSQNKRNICERTTLEGYLDIKQLVTRPNFNWYITCMQSLFRIISFYAFC